MLLQYSIYKGDEEIIVLTGDSLTPDMVEAIAAGRQKVSVEETLWKKLEEARSLVFELSGRGIPIYGCNTGVGWNKDKKVTKEFITGFNNSMLHSHAVGVGPYAPVEVVRAVMAVRLNGFLNLCTGISPGIVRMYQEFLNREIHPLMPVRGSVGQADIGNLSHIALAVTGEGCAEYHGEILPVSRILKQEGLKPAVPAEKDGLAMISSNALSAGWACLVLSRAEKILTTADVISCMSLEGFGGNTSQLRTEAAKKRKYEGQIETAKAMNGYLKGSFLYEADSSRPLQDPLCYRSTSQVHGAVRDALYYAKKELSIQINSSDDNPCLLQEERDITPSANFEPLAWVLPLEMLSIAFSHISKASCLRSIKLANPAFTRLTRNLSPQESVIAFSTIQKTFTALDAEIRSLANPVSMDTLPLAGEIEDRSTNAPLVVGRLEKILDDLCYILGIELMLAGQAMNLRKGKILGEVTGRGLAVLREKIPFYDKDDRVLTEDIEAVCEMIKEGTFLRKLNV